MRRYPKIVDFEVQAEQRPLIRTHRRRGTDLWSVNAQRRVYSQAWRVYTPKLQLDPDDPSKLTQGHFDHVELGVDADKREVTVGLRAVCPGMVNMMEPRWSIISETPGLLEAIVQYDATALYRVFPQEFVIEIEVNLRRKLHDTDYQFKRRQKVDELHAVKRAIWDSEERRRILKRIYPGLEFPEHWSAYRLYALEFPSTFPCPSEYVGQVFKHQLDHVVLDMKGNKRVVGVRGELPFSEDRKYNPNSWLAGYDYFNEDTEAIDEYLARPLFLEDPSLYVFTYSPRPPHNHEPTRASTTTRMPQKRDPYVPTEKLRDRRGKRRRAA